MARNYSFKLSDELDAKIEKERMHKQVTYTDVIRTAVEEYFKRGKSRQNVETILFEIIRTRAVVLRGFDMKGKELGREVLEEAGKDAEAYLQERKNK